MFSLSVNVPTFFILFFCLEFTLRKSSSCCSCCSYLFWDNNNCNKDDLPSEDVQSVKGGLYISVNLLITSICSSVSWTASLYWESQGTYAAQNCKSKHKHQYRPKYIGKICKKNHLVCETLFIFIYNISRRVQLVVTL